MMHAGSLSHAPALTGRPDVAPGASEAAFAELEASVGLALETYSNVHRGTGYNSMATTLLYERARVLEAAGLERSEHTVVFCSPARAAVLEAQIGLGRAVVLSSRDLALPLGLRAVCVRADALPKSRPLQTGGGTAKIVSRRSVVWEDAPDRFEAGTPAVINAVAFARALELRRHFGSRAFEPGPRAAATALLVLRRDELLEFSGRELLHRLRQTMIGRSLPVPTEGGLLRYVHFDNAAST